MNGKIIEILLMIIVFLMGVPQVEANRNIFNNFTKFNLGKILEKPFKL